MAWEDGGLNIDLPSRTPEGRECIGEIDDALRKNRVRGNRPRGEYLGSPTE